MATNIAEALQGAGAVSAKPVTMEAIPEATIDVGGGSQSLDIEGLGVKRRKDDLSVATASTSQLAIEDLFGDLLDEVNFSDPSSVDAFRESAASRINEFDLNTFSNILGEASTVASDLATLTSQFQGNLQPQQQFEQVFGTPDTTSSDDAGDIGLDTATSTEAQDISDLTNPGLAAGLVGGAFGAIGPGAGLSGLGTSLASQALSDTGVAGVFGGFNSVKDALNTEINDIPSAINATANALSVGRQAASVTNLVNSNVTITDLFDRATKNVEEFIGGIVSAVTNPAQTLEAFGLEMAYGTTTPDLYSFNFPGGQMNFAFDKKTGKIAVPGMVNTIVSRSPLGTFYSLAQRGLSAVGYTDAMADRNQSAVNAFSMPGVTLGAMSVHNSNTEASIGVDPETGAASTVGAFGAVDMSQQGYGMVGFDLGAVASAIGTGTISDLDFTDFQDAAITGHLGHGPLDFGEEEVVAQAIAANFSEAGLDTAQGIASAAERASQATAAFAANLEAFTGLDITALGAVDVAGRAGALNASQAAAVKAQAELDPYGVLAARTYTATPPGIGMTMQQKREKVQEQFVKDYEEASVAAAQAAIDAYNSPEATNNPDSIEIATRTMAITGRNTVDYNRDKAVVDEVAKDLAAEKKTSGDLDFGYDAAPPSIGPSGVSAPGYEAQGLQAARTGQVGVTPDFMAAIEAIEDAPSFEEDPEYDPGVDEPGSPDSESGGPKVICTALKDMGLLDKELWQHDGAYGRTLPLETRQGYWAWGVPTAKFIRKNRWAAKAIRPVVTEVAKEMAHRVGYGKGSKLGAALLYVGLPMCRVINRIKNNGNNTGSVYS